MRFMDFCAGIGGGRLGLELNNIECVAHSEIDIILVCTMDDIVEFIIRIN